jgi:cellulose biosynthesis protein BcsQ
MTASALRQLSKPCLIVLNQCPPKRGAHEAPAARKAREALRFTNYPVAQTALSSRAAFSEAVGRGLGLEELDPRGAAAREMAALWTEIEAAAWTAPARGRATRAG